MLHIFAEQRVTAGLQRRGDNQRVVEGKVVIAGERKGGLVVDSEISRTCPDRLRTRASVASISPQGHLSLFRATFTNSFNT